MITETVQADQLLDTLVDMESARKIIIHKDGTDMHFDGAYIYNGKTQVTVWWTNPYNAECPFTSTLRQDSYLISYPED